MTGNSHVSVSFPQHRQTPTVEQVLRLELALKDQQLNLAHFIAESRLAMTRLLSGDSQASEFINGQLTQLQARYLAGEWHDTDLNCDIKEVVEDVRKSGEIWGPEEIRDHLRPLFWCIDLEDVDGYEAWRRIGAGLDELVDLSSEGFKHWVHSGWVVGTVKPDNEPHGLVGGLWRRLHRVAALPAQVRELIGIERMDESSPPDASADPKTEQGLQWF